MLGRGLLGTLAKIESADTSSESLVPIACKPTLKDGRNRPRKKDFGGSGYSENDIHLYYFMA